MLCTILTVLDSGETSIYFLQTLSNAMFGHILHPAGDNDSVKQNSKDNVECVLMLVGI